MNQLEMSMLVALVRREQALLNVTDKLFTEHLTREQSHGVGMCELCHLYHENDERASVMVPVEK